MPNTAVLNAWAFDPGFFAVNSPLPPGWEREDASGTTAGVVNVSGDAIDLGALIVEVTLTDVDEDGFVIGGSPDTLTVDGETFTIGAVFDGDQIVIDGQTYNAVTFYVGLPGGGFLAFSIPRDPDTNELLNAFSGTTERTDWLLAANNIAIPIENFPPPPCFTPGTLIDTPTGPVPVEALRVGDLVSTRDNGPQAIRWIGSASLGAGRLANAPQFRPIRIRAGALGGDRPARDLIVSPQHRVLVRSAIAQRMFGTDEILVAAKHLVGVEGIEIDAECTAVTYLHILCDHHEVVYSNGAETETLFLGPQGLRGLDPAARSEIKALFPELAAAGDLPPSARVLASGRMGRRLVARHIGNARPLVN